MCGEVGRSRASCNRCTNLTMKSDIVAIFGSLLQDTPPLAAMNLSGLSSITTRQRWWKNRETDESRSQGLHIRRTTGANCCFTLRRLSLAETTPAQPPDY